MLEFVQCEIIGSVGVVRVDNPPVNALSPGVPAAILSAVANFAANDQVAAIVLAGAGRTFIAGADIRELQQMAAGEKKFDASLQRFLDHLEATPKPLIAAIHGTALGGGLETAMACHWRIADRQAVVGQPEVNLGLIPGAAGTQRLPRLVGVVEAARLCALGQSLSAEQAATIRLIDQVIEGDLIERAISFAQEVASLSLHDRRTSHLQDRLGDPEDNTPMLDQLRDEVSKTRPGESAPQLAIEAVASAATLPFDAGCEHELRLFDECMNGAQAKAMIRAFFGVRKAAMAPSPAAKELAPWKSICIAHFLPSAERASFVGVEHFEKSPIELHSVSLANGGGPLEPSHSYEAILLVPHIAPDADANQQAHTFQEQLSAARACANGAPLLIVLPEAINAHDFLDTADNEPLIWIGFSPCGGKSVEVYVGPGVDDSLIDRLLLTFKSLRVSGFRRSRLGPPAISVLRHAAQHAGNELIAQGVSRSKVEKSLARVGFRCDFGFDQMSAGEPSKLTSSKIVTACVSAMLNAAMQMQEKGTFADDLIFDMLAIASGLYPSYRGGPCWEQAMRS